MAVTTEEENINGHEMPQQEEAISTNPSYGVSTHNFQNDPLPASMTSNQAYGQCLDEINIETNISYAVHRHNL